jgi:hypothetical protein
MENNKNNQFDDFDDDNEFKNVYMERKEDDNGICVSNISFFSESFEDISKEYRKKMKNFLTQFTVRIIATAVRYDLDIFTPTNIKLCKEEMLLEFKKSDSKSKLVDISDEDAIFYLSEKVSSIVTCDQIHRLNCLLEDPIIYRPYPNRITPKE